MTYVEETSYFEIVPPGHTITYKNVYTYVRFCLITLILLIINNVNIDMRSLLVDMISARKYMV